MFEAIAEQPLAALLLGFLTLALATDVLERRIPNGLVALGLLAGVAGHALRSFPDGLVAAAAGAVAGLVCLLPFYLGGKLGAGDVKLMAMCGAFLGPVQVVAAAAVSLVAGGVIGVLWFFRQYFSQEGHALPADVASFFSGPPPDRRHPARSAVPYALAIYAGVVLVLIASQLPGGWDGGAF